MILQIHADARNDFLDAVEYFADSSVQLSNKFIIEFEHCIVNIQEFPTAWSPIPFHCRRILFPTFQYSIIYRIEKNEIIVLAIMHNARDPYFWISRI